MAAPDGAETARAPPASISHPRCEPCGAVATASAISCFYGAAPWMSTEPRRSSRRAAQHLRASMRARRDRRGDTDESNNRTKSTKALQCGRRLERRGDLAPIGIGFAEAMTLQCGRAWIGAETGGTYSWVGQGNALQCGRAWIGAETARSRNPSTTSISHPRCEPCGGNRFCAVGFLERDAVDSRIPWRCWWVAH